MSANPSFCIVSSQDRNIVCTTLPFSFPCPIRDYVNPIAHTRYCVGEWESPILEKKKREKFVKKLEHTLREVFVFLRDPLFSRFCPFVIGSVEDQFLIDLFFLLKDGHTNAERLTLGIHRKHISRRERG